MVKAFECRKVVKKFPGFTLGPIDLDLEPGIVLGLVGKNGAGKTTLLQCLMELLRTNSGEIRVFGRLNDLNRPQWKLNIGYVGDFQAFWDENKSGQSNLGYLSQFYPDWSHETASSMAKRFRLPLDKRVKELSTGNRVKLALVMALAHFPRLLILDEPTSGMDPVVRSEVLDALFETLETGDRSILYATHILSDINRLADDLAFVDNGSIRLRTQKEALIERWRKVTFRLGESDVRLKASIGYRREGREHQLITPDFRTTLKELKDLGAENIQGVLIAAFGLAALHSQLGPLAVAQGGGFPGFIPMPGISPRGVAVDKAGNVYVSASVIIGADEYISIWKFTPDGEPSFLAEIGQGTIGGLMVSAKGDLYIALAAGIDRGVYRMDQKGNIELLPGSDQIFFANGLAFDNRGTLYITESVSLTGPPPPFGQGGIWRIPRGGTAELCLRDELLTGTGVLGQPVPFGANGIVYYRDDLYVTNTEKETVLRIPVWPDGSLGLPEVWTTLQEVPESPLAEGPLPVCGDGIILDVHGNLYVAVLTRSAVVRIDARNLSQETVAAFRIPVDSPLSAPLDFPASLFFGTGKGERQSLFVTNVGLGALFVPLLPWAGSGLVKIDADVPGLPFH